MKSRDELERENQALRERISKLSAASLRISASLDVNVVLREIVASARTLTGARRGIIVATDESGQVQEYVLSGPTPDEQQRLERWADGPRFFDHLQNLSGVLRLNDLSGYVHSLGYSAFPVPSRAFQCTPLRHRDVHVGNFSLAGKEGGQEFTNEDEEVLVMFAAQAATAIANARTYRDEQRARADLEALVDTSPVGVVVFDVQTGTPLLFNQEAKRLVEGLRTPDRSPDQLLEDLMLRRADGREIALKEFPLEHALSVVETVRAEEIVLSVPDGRSVTTLVNSTPILSGDGGIESVVVTMQDLAPLQELERLRAEFLGLVSHELRTPLTSIKGSATNARRTSPAPDPAVVQQFLRIIEEQADRMDGLLDDLLDTGRIETGALSVAPEPTEVSLLVDQARNTFLSGGGRHPVRIDLPPDLPRVLADGRRIVQVLNNLLSNAAKYSPESSPIRVSALRDGVHVAISVSDEGRGVSPDLLPQLFRKYTRVASGRVIGGSGLGLAICKGLVEAHGGRIRAESGGVGLGTRFTFTIPVADEAAAGFARDTARTAREGGGRTRILVVDDDPQTLGYVRDSLAAAGYSPLLTGDPREVPRLIRTKRPRLILLDLILPGTDGVELMQQVPEMADLPVIFISAYGRDETIAKALKAGADDYIVKPFSPTELVARVQAALRRRNEPREPFRFLDLAIRYDEHRVTLAGRPVSLTATEYDLLRVLSVNAGRVVTYDSLLRQVWGRQISADRRLLRTYVQRLRRKLGDDAARPVYIFNQRQVGYRMPRENDP